MSKLMKLYTFCVCLVFAGLNSANSSVISPVIDNFSEVEFNVSGLMPAVFTPLYDNQTVNLNVIPPYVGYLYNNGIKAVLVGGSSGEHMSLSVASRKKVIDEWLRAADVLDLHVQVQVGGAPFPDVMELVKYCVEKGAHSILTLPDLYFKPTTVEELVSYVELIANAAPNVPVFYYHIPKKTYVTVSMPAFVEMASARIPNFKGLKFTSSDLVEAAQVLKVLRNDQKFFLGGEYLLAPAAILGIDSCISPANNLFPGLMQNILDEIKIGRVAKATELQNKLSTIVSALSAEGGRIPAMKVAMEVITGIKMGPPALPMKPVTDDRKKKIAELLLKFNNNIA